MTDTGAEITATLRDGGRLIHLRRIHLRVTEGPDEGMDRLYELETVAIGTRVGADLQLTDSTVSRSHALLARTPEGLLLRDLGSTNGIWVGNLRVREVYLGVHQRFRIGRTEVELLPADELVSIVPSQNRSWEGLVGESVEMREVFSVMERVAPTDLTVLVTGETGTGKELAAAALHRRSLRADGPLVVLDCGAVPRNLMEAELFGHEKGAFTGAHAARAGVFEAAHRGTLFLDELGELPLELQPALLRVLETRRVRRIGGHHDRKVDVRILAATNRDLRNAVAAGRFREDLYYRLAVVEVSLPPLRRRREDIPLLTRALLDGGGFSQGISADALARLSRREWPGNVRELRNALLRAASLASGPTLDTPDFEGFPALPVELAAERAPETPTPTLKEARDAILDDFERQYLEDLLQKTGGNLSEAARLAEVDRKTLTRLVKRHNLHP